jgi:hypothetical protein
VSTSQEHRDYDALPARGGVVRVDHEQGRDSDAAMRIRTAKRMHEETHTAQKDPRAALAVKQTTCGKVPVELQDDAGQNQGRAPPSQKPRTG